MRTSVSTTKPLVVLHQGLSVVVLQLSHIADRHSLAACVWFAASAFQMSDPLFDKEGVAPGARMNSWLAGRMEHEWSF